MMTDRDTIGSHARLSWPCFKRVRRNMPCCLSGSVGRCQPSLWLVERAGNYLRKLHNGIAWLEEWEAMASDLFYQRLQHVAITSINEEIISGS